MKTKTASELSTSYSLPLLPRSTEERCIRRAADTMAEIFWGESWADYGAAVFTKRDDGAINVSVSDGGSAWDSLCLAANGDASRASALAELDTRDGWQMTEVLGGHVQMRTIETAAGETVAVLFKR